jgi:hypothetical protein
VEKKKKKEIERGRKGKISDTLTPLLLDHKRKTKSKVGRREI